MLDSNQLNKTRYSRFASNYVESESHAKGADLDLLLEIAQPQADWTVLDIATGGGHTALKFAPHVAHVTATDITPKMLAEARRFITQHGISNIDFEIADAEDLPFEESQFDLVTCRIAPHHFPNIDQFVREAARVLKPNGMLLVQDHVLSEDDSVASFSDEFEKLRDPGHNFALTETHWVAYFEAAGISVWRTHHLVKRHNFIDWARRQGNSDETIQRLSRLLASAPSDVKAWMQPLAWETSDASFVNHHIIIAGRKSDS